MKHLTEQDRYYFGSWLADAAERRAAEHGMEIGCGEIDAPSWFVRFAYSCRTTWEPANIIDGMIETPAGYFVENMQLQIADINIDGYVVTPEDIEKIQDYAEF